MASRMYQLTLEGDVGDSAAYGFEGMTLLREDGMTVLRGSVRDQAELHGLLHRVADLGLTLLSATPVDAMPPRDRNGPVLAGPFRHARRS